MRRNEQTKSNSKVSERGGSLASGVKRRRGSGQTKAAGGGGDGGDGGEEPDDEEYSRGDVNGVGDAPPGDGDGSHQVAVIKSKKPRKSYTASASKVLKVAQQAAQTAARVAQAREEKEDARRAEEERHLLETSRMPRRGVAGLGVDAGQGGGAAVFGGTGKGAAIGVYAGGVGTGTYAGGVAPLMKVTAVAAHTTQLPAPLPMVTVTAAVMESPAAGAAGTAAGAAVGLSTRRGGHMGDTDDPKDTAAAPRATRSTKKK